MPMPLPTPPPGRQTQAIIEHIAHGTATSRSELARVLGVAPSTVALRINELTELGVVVEDGTGVSRGGRKPRVLRLREDGGHIMVADLGGHHARIGRFTLTGSLVETRSLPVRVEEGPEPTLRTIADAMKAMAAASGGPAGIKGVGLALPGPVDVATGDVKLPSRMPDWPGFGVRAWLEREFGAVAVVDNDANLSALGEHHAQLGPDQHSITVKAGTAIGSGIIVRGELYRGATGAAGDVTHTRVAAAGDEPCSCGNTGCLETIASGAGLVRQLARQGVAVESTADVLDLVHKADPIATTMLRTAGTYLGEVLSSVVNFFNPDCLFLTGGMASSELFIAAVRSRVYEGCHPLVTQNLRIEAARTGPDAGLHGAARLVLDQILGQSRPAGH
ncbi:ROK family transcriptional regulator [Specibacter cremeus]|uniref:ROK family transcriptional regulator n=1 Tax=Specibacter cremeus TaxID=1629051 RepID=UPI000F798664|nr:ROK family transcriptional regulator [Specibacter cremeus]